VTSEEKVKVFEKELGYIKDNNIRKFTEEVIKILPDYFFIIASSSTGKYHPKFALGEGGLLRHTKAAVQIGMDLLQQEMFQKYTDNEKDIIIASLIPHDGVKHGVVQQQYSVAEHPKLIVEYIKKHKEICEILNSTILEKILDCIHSHMGMYNTDYRTKKEILPKPKTKLENFVHLCDYLSSRKYFEEFNFDIDIIRK